MFPSKILHKEKAGFGGFSKFRVECFLGLKSRRTKDQGCRERIRNGCPAHPALYISIPAVSRFAQRKVKKWRAPLRHFQIREHICRRNVIEKSILVISPMIVFFCPAPCRNIPKENALSKVVRLYTLLLYAWCDHLGTLSAWHSAVGKESTGVWNY